MANKNTMGEDQLADVIYDSMTSRRSFFKKATLAGAGLALGSITGGAAFASPAFAGPFVIFKTNY